MDCNMNMDHSEHFSDEQLVVAVRERDKELYGELIRRYQTKLSHYLRKFIRNTQELEDVLQEVFIKAYRNLFDFDVAKRFSSWIYRICRNEAFNHIKKHSKDPLLLDEQEWEVIDEKIDLGNFADRNILKKDIESGLSAMKDKYREPLLLYFFEQKTYEEIGDILRLSRNTVGTLIARGKNSLKKILENKYAP